MKTRHTQFRRLVASAVACTLAGAALTACSSLSGATATGSTVAATQRADPTDSASGSDAPDPTTSPEASGSDPRNDSPEASGTDAELDQGTRASDPADEPTGASATSSAAAGEPGPIPTMAPNPGSSWTPPAPTADDAELVADFRKFGYEVRYQDPATFPKPAAPPERPYLAPTGFENTPRAARDIALYYFEAYNYFINSGDYSPLAAATATTCTSCNELTMIQRTAASDPTGFSLASRFVVGYPEATLRSDGGYDMRMEVMLPNIRTYHVNKSLVVTAPKRHLMFNLVVGWSDEGHFIVYDVQAEDYTTAVSGGGGTA
ncbi:hypothetical protein JT358_15255 [Micrococcales bacterium 31B]|nr:hypothetical protein [Micrococcales bacterium 31B]